MKRTFFYLLPVFAMPLAILSAFLFLNIHLDEMTSAKANLTSAGIKADSMQDMPDIAQPDAAGLIWLAFKSSGAELQGVDVSAWANVSASAADSVCMEQRTQTRVLANRLNTPEENVHLNYRDGCLAVSVSDKVVASTGTGVDTVEGLEGQYRMLRDYLNSLGGEPRVNLCLTGTFNGRLTQQQMYEVRDRVLKQCDATQRSALDDGGLLSVTAYSPLCGSEGGDNGTSCIIVDRQKVNINIALRYNSFEHKTYFWAATPVILQEY